MQKIVQIHDYIVQALQVMFTVNISMREKCDLCDMVVGAGLSVS